MNRHFGGYGARLCVLLIGLAVAQPVSSRCAEDTFDLLQIGTQTYTNVTVTSKKTNYVFIVHSGGMTSLKVKNLPEDVLVKLGYIHPSTSKVNADIAVVWAKQTLEKLPVEHIKAVEKEVKKQFTWNELSSKLPFPVPPLNTNLIIALTATLLAFHVFFSFCCKLICQKAGKEPGILIWIPVLQLLPLLHAARMSRWWFLAYFVPVLNVAAQVMWSFKIADARNKSAVIGFFLLLPLVSNFAFMLLSSLGLFAYIPVAVLISFFLLLPLLGIFAFLFLAFADEVPNPKDQAAARPIEIMSLEAV